MKKVLLAAMSIAPFLSVAARAAEMPLKAPPAPVPSVDTWTGFYLGVNVGGAWQHGDTTFSAGSGPFGPFLFGPASAAGVIPSAWSQNSSGVLGGITVGYNLQRGALVFGVEGDAMGTRLNATSTLNTNVFPFPPLATSTTTETDWLATARGRLGWLVVPDTLLYATGGVAFGGVKGLTSVTPNGAGFGSVCASNALCSTGSASTTQSGWTAGAGAEYKFATNWSVKLEYLHYDLGTLSYTANEISAAFPAAAGTPNFNIRTRVTGEIVRAGVNFHF